MKAVMAQVPDHILQWRQRIGADQWDEMWEGVLHMPPAPNRDHQDLEFEIEFWLRQFWAEPNGYRVYHQINVVSPGGWPGHDYRIPDLVLLTPDRFPIDHNESFEGAPNVIVEIHSPGDEAYEKLPFDAELGVPEAWIIDRDAKRPEVHIFRDAGYQLQPPDSDGWISSPATGIELRHMESGRLALRLIGDEASQTEIPKT